MPNYAKIISDLSSILGSSYVLIGADALPFLTDWRKRYTGKALAVLKPGSTKEVSQVVRYCAQQRIAITPQGGNTGLVGGATPDESGQGVVICLTRLNEIRSIDDKNNTMTVEAGCTLLEVQNRAHQAGRLFPLSLAAEGSCTIGGNIATNAGGTQVLQYGNMRHLTLGLEVVTPEGKVWDGLKALRKDNSGYSLRDLYIGSEGTLGIITAATLKLYPLPKAQITAVASLASIDDAVALLNQAHNVCASSLTAFELMSQACIALVNKHLPQLTVGLDKTQPYFVLLEISDHESAVHAQSLLENLFEITERTGLVSEFIVASSSLQSQALWQLREHIPLAQAQEGKNIKHDISLPISAISDFMATINSLIESYLPGTRPIVFGHLGDGNLHYNLARPEGMSEATFFSHHDALQTIVHNTVKQYEGSISAEHGIGQFKVESLIRHKTSLELDLMRSIKNALDPLGIMNPGKIFNDLDNKSYLFRPKS